jgi:NAD(P)H dehydrogenase (quinone)
MNIAVAGATGQLGRLVINKLKEKVPTSDIIALARSPQKAASLDVEVREADYDKPETLEAALAGVDTLLLISADELGRRAEQHHNVIEAAKKTGVKRIVYTSMLYADRSPIGLAAEHWATERELMTSGVPFTILRNGWYTENNTGSIPGALAGGALLGSAGGGRISSAARADYADAAVAALLDGSHSGKTYELAGDESWTMSDLAAEISRQTGRDIPYKDLPEADYADALAGFGLPEPVARAVAGFDVGASQGALFDDSHRLSALIGHPTTPMSATVAETLK